MTVHASILEQLGIREARTGEKCVPRRSGWYLKLDDPDGDGGFFEWWLGDREIMIVDSHDAHAHIREAGLLAVMNRGYWIRMLDDGRYQVSKPGADHHNATSLADAIDAALRTLNSGGVSK